MKLENYPFLRILIPLSLGIAIGYFSCTRHIDIPHSFWGVLCFIPGVCLIYFSRIPQFSKRWIPGLSISLLFFSFGGFISCKEYNISVFLWPEQPCYYKILITSGPQKKNRSVAYEALVKGYYPTFQSRHDPCREVHKKILLYLPPTPPSGTLRKGQTLLIHSTIQLPENNGNPEEFDYARYLLRKGISGSTYTPKWEVVPFPLTAPSLSDYAETFRAKLLSFYKNAGLTGKEFGALAALTLGYKEDLSEDTRRQFSQAGISHVLALSGLHIGIVYVLVEFLLRVLLRKKQPGLRLFLCLGFLWSYAFLTGMLPPVIRAATMCSLFAIVHIRSQRSLSFNTLSAAAFFILCFKPFWLFDASFQLSFSAVSGILLWQPWLSKLYAPRFRFIRYIWSIVCISLSAQLAALPFVLYYFGSFPCYFLLANVASLGLITLIIYSGIVLWILFPFPFLQMWVGGLIQLEFKVLFGIVNGVANLPGAEISHLYLTGIEAALLAFLLLFGMEYLITKKRNARLILCGLLSGCLLLVIQTIRCFENKDYFPSMVFFNQSKSPTLLLLFNKHQSFLWTDNNPNSYETALQNTSRFRNRIGIRTPQRLDSLALSTGLQSCTSGIDSMGILRFENHTICHLKDDRWHGKTSLNPLHIDFLWISKGYTGSLKSVSSLFHIKEVIIDASLSEKIQKNLEQECIHLHIPCRRLKSEGAYTVRLRGEKSLSGN